jgi:hypothetical protein
VSPANASAAKEIGRLVSASDNEVTVATKRPRMDLGQVPESPGKLKVHLFDLSTFYLFICCQVCVVISFLLDKQRALPITVCKRRLSSRYWWRARAMRGALRPRRRNSL